MFKSMKRNLLKYVPDKLIPPFSTNNVQKLQEKEEIYKCHLDYLNNNTRKERSFNLGIEIQDDEDLNNSKMINRSFKKDIKRVEQKLSRTNSKRIRMERKESIRNTQRSNKVIRTINESLLSLHVIKHRCLQKKDILEKKISENTNLVKITKSAHKKIKLYKDLLTRWNNSLTDINAKIETLENELSNIKNNIQLTEITTHLDAPF